MGWAAGLLETLNFTESVLNGVLSILLFAGALSLDAAQMFRQRVSILTPAVLSTLLSTFLISPTDPVAVLDLLRRARVPARIETLIAGESLFNDGVGIVVFLVLAGLAGVGEHHAAPGLGGALTLFMREALGGMLFGALLGGLGTPCCASSSSTRSRCFSRSRSWSAATWRRRRWASVGRWRWSLRA